jgi:hypothetical protein
VAPHTFQAGQLYHQEEEEPEAEPTFMLHLWERRRFHYHSDCDQNERWGTLKLSMHHHRKPGPTRHHRWVWAMGCRGALALEPAGGGCPFEMACGRGGAM